MWFIVIDLKFGLFERDLIYYKGEDVIIFELIYIGWKIGKFRWVKIFVVVVNIFVEI